LRILFSARGSFPSGDVFRLRNAEETWKNPNPEKRRNGRRLADRMFKQMREKEDVAGQNG